MARFADARDFSSLLVRAMSATAAMLCLEDICGENRCFMFRDEARALAAMNARLLLSACARYAARRCAFDEEALR